MAKRTEHEEKQVLHNITREVKKESHQVTNAFTREADNILRELGAEIGKSDPAVKHAKYLGSAAVHIYETENQLFRFFVSQAGGTLGGIPEAVASAAFSDLRTTMANSYGRKLR